MEAYIQLLESELKNCKRIIAAAAMSNGGELVIRQCDAIAVNDEYNFIMKTDLETNDIIVKINKGVINAEEKPT